jgi:VWFA-related protein
MKPQLLGLQRMTARLLADFENISGLTRITLPLMALILGATIPICAQQAGETNGAGTLSANTELVLVPVLVTDYTGKPVPGLHQSDFVLHSDGKAQPIKIFEDSGAAPEVRTSLARRVAPSTAASQEFSTVPEGGMPQHLLIIPIDWINSPYVEQGWAQQELLKYFSKGTPEEPFALVAITENGLVQIHSFSSDPKALLESIREQHAKIGKAERKQKTAAELRTPETKLMAMAAAAVQESVEMKAVNATVLSFEQLERAYAGIPGRKSLIWLSDKMPDVPAIAAILNRGNIALYPVNLRGVPVDIHYLTESTAVAPPPPAMPIEDNGMRELASQTGGRYCYAMETCIGQAIEDSTNYYLLGFYVAQQDRQPGWHKLSVQLTSNRGSVHARSGYYLEPRNAPGEGEMLSDLIAAANAQIAYTGVAFSVQRLTESIGLQASTVGFRIRVPATSVLLQSGQRNLSYEIAMVSLSQKGEPTAEAQTIRLDLNAERTERALTQGWRYDETLPRSGSVAAVKFIVRDNDTGNIGSVVVPLTQGRKN